MLNILLPTIWSSWVAFLNGQSSKMSLRLSLTSFSVTKRCRLCKASFYCSALKEAFNKQCYSSARNNQRSAPQLTSERSTNMRSYINDTRSWNTLQQTQHLASGENSSRKMWMLWQWKGGDLRSQRTICASRG